MKIRTYRHSLRLFVMTVAAALAIIFVGTAGAQEHIDKVQQAVVGGTVVTAETREKYGLVTLNSTAGS